MSGLRYIASSRLLRAALWLVALLALATTAAFAEEARADKKAAPEAAPIIITSESLIANKKDNTAEFTGKVVAKSGDMTLYSEWMKVYYAEGGKLDHIDAKGSVRLVKDTQVLTSEEAVYNVALARITFTGNPRAVDGNSVLTGTRMVYLTEEERFMVEGGRVLIDRGREGALIGNGSAVSIKNDPAARRTEKGKVQ